MASRFWVGGTANWNVTSSWSATSGGASGASVPVAGDDVFFDANSGNGISTLSASLTIGSLDCTGYTGTLAIGNSQVLTLNGAGSFQKFALASGMTFSRGNASSGVTFTHTTGTAALTSSGKSLCNVTLNGSGGTTQLQDNLATDPSVVVTVTLGTLDTNGKNISTGGFVGANSASAGMSNVTGTITINGSTGLSIGGSSFVATLTSATIVIGDFAGSATCALANKSVGTLTVNANTGSNSGSVSITFTTITIATLGISGPRRVTFSQGGVLTITNSFSWSGPLVLHSSSIGTQYTLTLGAASTIASGSAAMVQDMNVTGAALSITGYSLNNNTFGAGGGISAPSGGGSARMIGG